MTTPAAPALSSLDSGEAHLWYVDPERVTDPDLLADFQDLLSPQERLRQRAFAFARDAHQYLVTRALVRLVLSGYAAVPPRSWELIPNVWGKPEIRGPAETSAGLSVPPLRFNVSHTRGLIVCAVTLGVEVGVDAESLERTPLSLEVADRFFAPSEAAHLRQTPAERRWEMFLDFWTLKEAYIKARGLGLNLPLDEFAFQLGPEGVSISFTPRMQDDPHYWQFARYSLERSHKLAVALHRPPGQDIRVQLRAWSPGRWSRTDG
jgi:4'-phosphopantetheinyl transferase